MAAGARDPAQPHAPVGGVEGRDQRLDAGEALAGGGGQRPVDHSLQGRRDRAHVLADRGARDLAVARLHDLGEHLRRGPPRVGQRAGEGLEQHDPQGVDVGALVDPRRVLELLRRHVERGAQAHVLAGELGGEGDRLVGVEGRRRRGLLGAELLGDPEVGEVQPPRAVDEEVRGLDVAVDDAGGVGLGHEPRGLVDPLDPLQQRAAGHVEVASAVDEVDHQVEPSAGELAPVEGAHDPVLTAQQVAELRLALEPRGGVGRAALRAQDLDRDLGVELLVPGAEHDAHATAADLLLHEVAAGDLRRHVHALPPRPPR
ncbi:MAG: hypothetical protein R3F62_16265 [Planctomycetota bacterium]